MRHFMDKLAVFHFEFYYYYYYLGKVKGINNIENRLFQFELFSKLHFFFTTIIFLLIKVDLISKKNSILFPIILQKFSNVFQIVIIVAL